MKKKETQFTFLPYTALEIWYTCTCTCFLLIDSIDGAACALNFFYIFSCQIKTLPLRNSSHIVSYQLFQFFLSRVKQMEYSELVRIVFSLGHFFFLFYGLYMNCFIEFLCVILQGDMKSFSELFKANETSSLQSANTKSDSFTIEMERLSDLSKNVSPNSRITVSSICCVLNSHHFDCLIIF